ncbi:MAG TPA: amidohydrolase family protein [Vicinamibacterales bacterium]|nr:amidohydrolase family protein [Vicinamibacterales bacterium]
MRAAVLIALLSTSGVLLSSQARPLVAPAATAIYLQLLPEIARITIFDHHAHPAWADDPDVDAAPPPPGTSPLRFREQNPEFAAASKAFAGLKRDRSGRAFFSAALDRLGIETSMANRVAMADYLDPARFKWVFFVDCFMFPFDNAALAGRNPDEASYMPAQEKVLQRYRQQAGAIQPMPTLDAYLAFVTSSLEDAQRRGGVAVKFEAAYFRSLLFDDPPHERAASVYSKYIAGGVPSAAEYKDFQDFVFRYLVTEAGRLHLPVHIHTSAGAGDYFMLRNVHVLNLENVVKDPRYASTTFVLIHGGYPADREAIFLASVKNVYLDSSATGMLAYPTEFKDILKRWLETFPDKITFGTDAFPYSEKIGAEAVYWIAVQSGRSALAAALAEMIAAREITHAQALTMARAFLHDTTAGLYKK